MRQSNRFRLVRQVAAGFLTLSAIRHAWLAIEGDPSVVRHAVFVAINAGLAILLVRWPKGALVAAAVLAIQQEYSHGSALLESIRGPGPFDFASLAVCLFFPAMIALLAIERRSADARQEA